MFRFDQRYKSSKQLLRSLPPPSPSSGGVCLQSVQWLLFKMLLCGGSFFANFVVHKKEKKTNKPATFFFLLFNHKAAWLSISLKKVMLPWFHQKQLQRFYFILFYFTLFIWLCFLFFLKLLIGHYSKYQLVVLFLAGFIIYLLNKQKNSVFWLNIHSVKF